ncbi:MAG TPA: hypothetical protein VFY16_11545 [Gemmatimonadaceae bacterium]|nr:hypothetical protein [Gemmatimonadaceae bacterium]
MIASVTGAGGFLFGRRTHENVAAYWPDAPREEQAIALPLNTRPKCAASTTLAEPLTWRNSTPRQANVAEAVAALKLGVGGDLLAPPVQELVV